MDPDGHAALERWWFAAVDAGIAGSGSVEAHLGRARAFAQARGGPADRFCDLGTGPGMPGLVLALLWPEARGVLIDATERRVAFVEQWVRELGVAGRITVEHGRAEVLAHQEGFRHEFDTVVARSFGPPAVVAECASGFLALAGVALVSEPRRTRRSPSAGPLTVWRRWAWSTGAGRRRSKARSGIAGR
ncbi:MAG: RsmG family class I SAM-dependent methyltransferase [Acidimicrobiales bacterium]